ncbi:protein ANTAGONIST OF LIKE HETEROCHROMATIN PROTEIN 1-like [Homalodisca vitripennis]|uniref:protein ANTAGONIST OF LIKE HETEROCHROMATIN PROTEIN 1-like n=1 Tax=Homalodisca vitripennis TaxID=197043 RepID=UPI001EEBBD90|nr:protein ANTAGONIST OF LIKE HETEROCHROMATIN PROTEIN 1-like [Homalodisca vitripennis]
MSLSEEEAVLLYVLKKQKKKLHRRFSVHPYNSSNLHSSQWHSLQKLGKYPEKFFNYYRMSKASFDFLLDLVTPLLLKQDTNYRTAIGVGERLTITLRFLGEGCSYHQLAYDFFRGVSTIAAIVPETCEAIWSVLQPLFMPVPDRNQWETIAERYEELWNLPNCLGSIDGKHIRIRSFDHSGSNYYNYKHFFSTVLMACADADGTFISIDVGYPGRNNDAGVFHSSTLGKWVKQNSLDFPLPRALPNNVSNEPVPFFFCGDEAFPLENLMRPYPRRVLNDTKRVFNYRLSRGRKSVECAFGMMSMKFRVLEKPIQCKPGNLKKIVQAVCVLHNFIKARDGTASFPEQFEYTRPRLTCIDDFRRSRKRNYLIRDKIARYFVECNPIPSQWD